jgi:hypothetical protein
MHQLKHKLSSIKIFTTLYILVLLAVSLGGASYVQAITCLRDPDYSASGSANISTSECGSISYNFENDPNSPNIVIRTKSQSGTSTILAALSLQDQNADPLVWSGTAEYDKHSIMITVNRGAFSQDGVSGFRYDNISPTKPVQLNLNAVASEFANAHDITISGASTEGSSENGDLKADCKASPLNRDNCKIIGYLIDFINALSAIVGIVIVIMIAYAGVQYSASRDNPQATAAAKDRIRNAIIALVLYLFIYAFLQWLVPGGIL